MQAGAVDSAAAVQRPCGSGDGTASAAPRRGVLPGSFLDLMTRATDRTTGMGFTDFEIANQVCCTCVHVLPLGLQMHPPGSLSCSLHTKARRTQ